jgi:ribonuclease T1
MSLPRASRRSQEPAYQPVRTGQAVVINEKDVVKNVDAATVQGMRTGASAIPTSRRDRRAAALFALVLAAAASFGALAPTRSEAKQLPGLGAEVSLASLSPEARRTDQLIHSGGPFPFSRDGVVFGNYEKRLERRPRGYYHEYTVPTPGARTRGARRIICGGTPPTEPDACFYTEDHYNSFHRIVN